MDLRDLAVFLEVARSGSVTRAASILHVAQPALSRRIQKLEAELGKQLFIRSRNGITLTEDGSILQLRAARILADVHELSEEVSGNSALVSGLLRIAVPPGVGLALFPEVLSKFASELPNVTLQVLEGTSNLLKEWLIGGRVDIAILHNPPSFREIEVLPLLRESLHLILPPGTVPDFAKGGTCRIRDLSQVPLIMPSLPHSNRVLLEQSATQHNVRLDIQMEIDSFNLIRRLVEKGIGASVMTAAAASRMLSGGVTPVSIQPPMTTVLCAATLVRKTPAPGQRRMIEYVRATLTEMVASGDWSGEVLG